MLTCARRAWRSLGLSLIVLACSAGVPLPTMPVHSQDTGPTAGRVLAATRGQVAWLNLEAARPTPLTTIARPAFPADIAAAPNGSVAVFSLVTVYPGSNLQGGDLVVLDLATGATWPLVSRQRQEESFDVPAVWPDGSGVLFQRSDLRAALAMPGQAQPQYRSAIEHIAADGSARTVVLDDARYPAPAPDSVHFAYVRTTSAGTSILNHGMDDGSDTTLVPAGAFAAIAYPRISPDGLRIAFAAVSLSAPVGRSSVPTWQPLASLFHVPIAEAHGYPWEVWLANADGTDLHQISDVMDDDPSVAWSPDSQSVLVYGGWGSFIIDAASGRVSDLPFLTGYGATAWVDS